MEYYSGFFAVVIKKQGGIAYLSEKTNLNKQNRYKILTGKATPRFDIYGFYY